MGNKKVKLNIPMCAALILLLLTMISIHLTSGLYARYTTTASGSDSARVAKFDVGCELVPVASKTNEVDLVVTNRSEVAVKYSLQVTSDAPLHVTIGDQTQSAESGPTAITFTNDAWTLAPGEDPVTHNLQFSLADVTYITKDASGESVTKPVAFSVNVTAEQID